MLIYALLIMIIVIINMILKIFNIVILILSIIENFDVNNNNIIIKLII